MIEEALDYYQDGNYEAAFALYQKMLVDEPGNDQVLYMMSLCRQKQGRWQDAIDHLNQAIDNFPDNALYHYAIGGLYMRIGDPVRAVQGYSKASELKPNEPRSRIGIGYALLSNNQLDEARQELMAAVRAADDQPEVKATAMAHLGVVALAQNQTDEALNQLQNAAELNPEDVYIQTHLGRAFMASGQAGFAVQCFQNAQNMNDSRYQHEPLLLLWLGQALEQTGDLTGAMNAWRELLQRGIEHPELLYHMARVYMQGVHPQQALNLLLRAKKIAPDAAQVRHLLATAYQQTGQTEAARRELESLPDNDRTGKRQLTRFYLSQARYSEATELTQQLIRDAEDPDLLLAAQVAVTRHDSEQAHQYLNQLDQVAQTSIPGTWLRALAYAGSDTEQAEKHLHQLQAKSDLPADIQTSAIRLQARLLNDQGKYAEALECLSPLSTRRSGTLSIIAESDPQNGIVAEEQLFDRDQILSWPPKAPGRARVSPVFVLGWPGSGRGQLIQALSLHPDISVARDRVQQANEDSNRYANNLDRRTLITWPRHPALLGTVSETDWLQLRNQYRKQLISTLSDEPRELIIDSMEFPVAGLIAIQRFYPDATIINLQANLDDLQLSWHWSGYQDIPAMREAYLSEQAQLKQARSALELAWVDIDASELMKSPKEALKPLMEHFHLDWPDSDTMLEPLTPALLSPTSGSGRQYAELFTFTVDK